MELNGIEQLPTRDTRSNFTSITPILDNENT